MDPTQPIEHADPAARSPESLPKHVKAPINAGRSHQYHSPWSREEDDKLIGLRQRGLRFAEVSQQMPGRKIDARRVRCNQIYGLRYE